ncbi:class I adenylate-forming enzyme family protein [Neorhizobium sp. DT-125]|uniref:class I adenylate-forming enzyme family protein n=1 Tax=Neorhizobium sp. DT-125 TaxID=3396163 RepID=UPI003F1B6D53
MSTEYNLSPFGQLDVSSLIHDRAIRRPDHPLLIWAPAEGAEATWTYASFAHQIACIAGGLASRGIRKGDRVLVHLENCPEALLARFACAWLGAVCVASNAMAAGPELANLAETTGPRAAITQPKFADLIASHVPHLDWIAVTGTDAGVQPRAADVPERALRFERLLVAPLALQAPPDPHAPALILFTTGTTARAKAVLWTHENSLWASCLGALQQGFRSDDVVQLFLPLFHVVGFSWTFLPILWTGGTVLLQSRFSASRFWPLALKHRATISAHVPFTLAALQQQEKPDHHFFQMWITNRQMPELQRTYGIQKFSSAWGMTEMIAQPIIGGTDHGPLAANSIGRPSMGYRIRIEDRRGEQVDPGGEGELLVGGERGRTLFREYFGNPQATRDAFDDRGFFKTGDRVRLLEDGSIMFVDRIKDVIKVGGEGVSASEVEAVIQQIDGVAEVAVVARPDPLRSEVPVAFVVLQAGYGKEITNVILQRCQHYLAKFKVPHEIHFLDELPKVGFGKVSKVKLRTLAAEASESAAR